MRKAVAENYIKRKNFDWKFKVVFGNEIILDENARRIYNHCLALKFDIELKSGHPDRLLKFDPDEKPLFSARPANGKTAFVMFGITGRSINNFTNKKLRT